MVVHGHVLRGQNGHDFRSEAAKHGAAVGRGGEGKWYRQVLSVEAPTMVKHSSCKGAT